MIHPHRSKEAFAALIDDWAGILVSDGYGVYQNWVAGAANVLGPPHPQCPRVGSPCPSRLGGLWDLGLGGVAAAVSYGHGPTDRGEWRAWYARLCKLIDQYHARSDEAGRFARRLLREMDSLWVFLAQHGVEPTNNRAERALRFGVLWRKRSLGTASTKGNHWVERILSLRETCRLQARSTYMVLVDAVASLFKGQQPDLSWIGQRSALPEPL